MLKAFHRAPRRLLGVVACSVLMALPTTRVAAEPEADDRLAIDFEATRLDGTPLNGLDLEGRVVLLDFWAVWCRPCIDAFPKLNGLASELAGSNFEIIGVTVHSGSRQEVADFLEGYDIQYTVVVADDELAYRFDVIGFPTYLLVGPDGTIYRKYVGDPPELVDRIRHDVMSLRHPHGSRSNPTFCSMGPCPRVMSGLWSSDRPHEIWAMTVSLGALAPPAPLFELAPAFGPAFVST